MDRRIFGTMKGCTADYLPISGKLDIKKRPPVWLAFGGPIQESFRGWLAGELAKFKRQSKLCVIELFSALMFRETAADKRTSGGESYVWETELHPTRKDAFFSKEGRKMQRQLIKTVKKIAKKSGCKYKISLMWEAQVLKGDPRFLPWLKEILAIVRGRVPGLRIKAGVHSHITSHYMAADFVVYEGNSAMDLRLVNLGKPVYCLRRNVSPFSPRHKERNFEGSKEGMLRLLQGQMLKELKANGCTAQPFDRYINQKVLDREIGKNDFDCSWFKKEMEKFILDISRELKKYHGKELPRNFGQEFVYRRESKPDPTPAPKPKVEDKEKYKKTEPLEMVGPVIKEKKMKERNPIVDLLISWWHVLALWPAMLITALINPWWINAVFPAWIVFAFFTDRYKTRKRKEQGLRREFLFAKSDDCPPG